LKATADVDAVLARRHDNGADFWATPDGRIGVGAPFSSLESLVILHELGVKKTHEAVRGALDAILANARDDGRFRVAPKGTIFPCHTAYAARVLCRFGYARDKRIVRTFEHLLGAVHEDGGWRCAAAPLKAGTRGALSNPGVTLFALDALRYSEREWKRPELKRAIDTLLAHWEEKLPAGPCQFGIGALFMQVEYPFFRYNLFYWVYVLSFYEKARRDRRFHAALRALESKLDDRGRVVVERPHRALATFALCAKGKPSERATARYREIRENIG